MNASQSLAAWCRSGWIHTQDPRGWFQWYCRYHLGTVHRRRQSWCLKSASDTAELADEIYTYLWQTETSWRNTCRDLDLLFVDGSTQHISFRFHK